MHSFIAPSGRIYRHNDDFSGDISFYVNDVGPDGPSNAYDAQRAEICMDDMAAMVAEMLRRRMIDRLEQMPYHELLEGRN